MDMEVDPYWRVWGVLYVASWGNKKMLWLLIALAIFQLLIFFNPNQYSPFVNQGFIASAVVFSIVTPWFAYVYLKHLNASDINGFLTGKLTPRAKVALPKWTSWSTVLTFGSLGLIGYYIFTLIQRGIPTKIGELINNSLGWISGFVFGPGLYAMYMVGLVTRYKIFHLTGIDKESLKIFFSKSHIAEPKLKSK